MKKFNYVSPAVDVLYVDLQQAFAQSNFGTDLGKFIDDDNILFD